MYSENAPRNWKWVLPLMALPVFVLITYWLLQVQQMWVNLLGCIPGTGVFACLVLTINNFLRYQREWQTDLLVERQRALNTTPATMMASALSGLHPEFAKILNKFAVKTRWDVNVDVQSGDQDWVLMGTNVHLGFVEFVLNNSSKTGIYPQNRFAEGSKKWDPDGLVEDREQYKEFEAWLIGRMIITKSFGNNPGQWLQPWNPQRIKEVMGIEGPQELYRPVDEPKPNGKNVLEGAMEDLIPLDQKALQKFVSVNKK